MSAGPQFAPFTLDEVKRAAAAMKQKKPAKPAEKPTAGAAPAFEPFTPKEVHQIASDMRDQQLKNELMGVARPIYHAGRDFVKGAAAGPPSTMMHASDWLRSTLANISPWYRRQLEEASKAYAAATPEQRKYMSPGYFRDVPEIRKMATPPNTTFGRIGFGAEQAGEELALGAAVPEIEGAGLLKSGLRIGQGALTGGVLGGAQTGTWEGAKQGAALGAGGAVFGEAARIGAPRAAERELFPKGVKRGEEAEARAAAERYVGKTGIKKASEQSIEDEIAANKAKLIRLTETNPAYSQRTVAIDDVLAPVKKRVAELEADPEMQKEAKALAKKLEEWRTQLGYKEPSAAQQVERKIKGPRGETLYDTTPGKAGQTTVTAANVNRWARGLAKEGETEGATAGRAALKKMIPEEKEAIEHAERATETDTFLRRAILALPQNQRDKLIHAGLLGLGNLGADAVVKWIETTYPGTGKTPELLRGVAAITSLISLGRRNPGRLTQSLLLLRKEGFIIPPAIQALFRQGMLEAAKPGEEEKGAGEKPEAKPSAPAKPRAENKASPFGLSPHMEQVFDAASRAHGVPPSILKGVMRRESGGNPNAVSPKGALGLMQFMPDTAKQYGVDPMDPDQAVDGAARYLHDLRQQTGSWELALAAYNAGPGKVSKYGGVPPYKETQRYVKQITGGG